MKPMSERRNVPVAAQVVAHSALVNVLAGFLLLASAGSQRRRPRPKRANRPHRRVRRQPDGRLRPAAEPIVSRPAAEGTEGERPQCRGRQRRRLRRHDRRGSRALRLGHRRRRRRRHPRARRQRRAARHRSQGDARQHAEDHRQAERQAHPDAARRHALADELGRQLRRGIRRHLPGSREGARLIFYPFFLDGVVFDAKLNQQDGMHPNAKGVAAIVEAHPAVRSRS